MASMNLEPPLGGLPFFGPFGPIEYVLIAIGVALFLYEFYKMVRRWRDPY